MSEWQETKISLVATYVNRGVSPKYTENLDLGICVINQKCIRNGRIDLSLARLHDQSKSANSEKFLQKGDILINSTGVGTAGRIAIFDEPIKALVDSHVTIVRPDKSVIHPEYLFHSLRYREDEIENYAEGSTGQIELGREKVKDIDISKPDSIEEQKAIASVLSSLDDKIDLLHRQNTTLERMAGTLFRQWFVEEAQENWAFVELGEYVNCFNGVSYKSSELNPSKTAMVTLKSFDRNGGFRLDGFKEFTGRYKEQHVVVQGDLVVAHTDITQDAEVIGNPVLVVSSPSYETIVISMDLVKVTSKFAWLSNEFLYRMMRTREFKEHCLGYSNGSTVLHLSKQAIPSYEFFLPPKEKIQSFTSNVKDMLGKKFKNIEQIQTLEKLRDALLPKLMSGEVRVN